MESLREHIEKKYNELYFYQEECRYSQKYFVIGLGAWDKMMRFEIAWAGLGDAGKPTYKLKKHTYKLSIGNLFKERYATPKEALAAMALRLEDEYGMKVIKNKSVHFMFSK